MGHTSCLIAIVFSLVGVGLLKAIYILPPVIPSVASLLLSMSLVSWNNGQMTVFSLDGLTSGNVLVRVFDSAKWMTSPVVLLSWKNWVYNLPQPIALHGVVATKMQNPELVLLNLKPLASTHWSRSRCRALLPSSRSTLIPNSVLSTNLLRVHLIPLSRSLMKTLNRTGSRAKPWGAAQVSSHQLDVAPPTLLWAIYWATFLLRDECTHPSHRNPVSPGESCGKQHQRLD